MEIMVTGSDKTRDAVHLSELSKKYNLPILSIHAPTLILMPFVWGRDPEIKLRRTAEFASLLKAETVVVHPPFRWQHEYTNEFLSVVRHASKESGVTIAVENMFPWRIRGKEHAIYRPTWDEITDDADALTFDFSHAALSGIDTLQNFKDLSPKLHHIHLCDGRGVKQNSDEGKTWDEHLAPGQGNQPITEALQYLASTGWDGNIITEVNTRKYRSSARKIEVLKGAADYARGIFA
jgi:sugar phosphate isomerase/epimerase